MLKKAIFVLVFNFCVFSQSIFSDEQMRLEGIIICKEPERVENKNIVGVVYVDVTPPGKSGGLTKKLQPYLGQELTLEVLNEVRNTIGLYYEENSNDFVVVSIPEQEVENGVVLFQVNLPKVGKIEWQGNQYFTQEQMEKYFLLESGEDLSQEVLLNDVSFSNKNPFHYTEVILKPSDTPGVTDIEFRTKDRFPIRVYVGADNTGNDYTGNTRLYSGFNWGNALWRGDVFTYQYTTNPNFNLFQSHFGQYIAYLPWKDILTVWGGYVYTSPTSQGDFTNKGQSAQTCFRYQIPFRPFYGAFTQEMAFGVDWKYTNSNVFFADFPLPVVNSSVNVLELIGNYGFNWAKNGHEINFSIDGHLQPWNILSNQNSTAYDQLRPGANAYYAFAVATFSDEYYFKNRSSYALLLRGQLSTAALLPMQQFSLGGYNTVRGYDEQAYLADDALCINFEYRLPPFQVYKPFQDELTFLAFVDYGVGGNYKKEGGLNNVENLIGIGPGLRYKLKGNLSVRADYGFKLNNVPFNPNNAGKLHVGAQLSF
jgi:hemolysin activation/secretion protein